MKKLMIAAAAALVGVVSNAETKVGIIGLDTSHAIAFTKIMNVDKDPGVAGFRMVAAYQWGSRDIVSSTNRYPKYIAQVKEMGVEVVPTIEELLAKVDVVCLETNDGREHLWQAEKVFAAGKPVFIDKPIAHNLNAALKIYELGKKYNAKYFSSSSLRFSEVAKAARAGRYGKIRGAALISPAPLEVQGTHNFYTWYGIHGFEPLVAVMGMGVDKVSCFRNETEDVINATWKDGRMGELRLMRKSWVYGGYILPEKPKDKKNPTITYDGYPGYEPLLREIIKFFKSGVPPVSPEETLEIMAFMEAAEMSAKRGGEPVTIAEAIEKCADCATWSEFLDAPTAYTNFVHTVRFVASYDFSEFTVECLEQANGPDTTQRVMMAIPKGQKAPMPCVVVPFYFPEAMLGFNPQDGGVNSPLTSPKTNLTAYSSNAYMSGLAKRGYVTISADAYHLTYAKVGAPTNRWSKWKHAGLALRRDWPSWTGIGKLIFDTRLLIDLVSADKRVDATRIGITGHSLGGKMAFYTGCLDPRIKVIVASDFGFGWDQTNWQDVWYWGDKLSKARAAGLNHTKLLSMAGGKPFCLIAGKYDNEESGRMMRQASGYEGKSERLKLINHATGHRPPPEVTLAGYDFFDKYLK